MNDEENSIKYMKKQDVDKPVKTKIESTLYPLESRVKKESDQGNSKIAIDEGKAWQKLMNLLMQLRKVCDQYVLFLSTSDVVLILCQMQSLTHTNRVNILFSDLENLFFWINFFPNFSTRGIVCCCFLDLLCTSLIIRSNENVECL